MCCGRSSRGRGRQHAEHKRARRAARVDRRWRRATVPGSGARGRRRTRGAQPRARAPGFPPRRRSEGRAPGPCGRRGGPPPRGGPGRAPPAATGPRSPPRAERECGTGVPRPATGPRAGDGLGARDVLRPGAPPPVIAPASPSTGRSRGNGTPAPSLAAALDLCRRVMADRPRFDAEERGYKLELAARIRQALEAAAAGREFVPALRRAFRAPNNLTHFLVHGPFLQWVGESPEAARAALAPLSDPALPPVERFARFVEGLPRFRRSGPGNLVALGSYLLMGVDPTRFPMVRVSRFEVVERALGWRLPPARSLAADLYAHHLGFAVWFLERLRAAEDAGPAPRTSGRAGTLGPVDMLDAQGLIWILAGAWGGQAPAVRAWRGDAAASPAPSLGSGQAHRTGGGVGPSRPPGPAAGPGTPSPSASGAAVYRLPAPDDRALVDLIA